MPTRAEEKSARRARKRHASQQINPPLPALKQKHDHHTAIQPDANRAQSYSQSSSDEADNLEPACQPWANEEEKNKFQNLLNEPWPDNKSIFDFPQDLEPAITEERKVVLADVKNHEIKMYRYTRGFTNFIDREFLRWKNVGCQLCYATTGEPEPDHKIQDCVAWDSAEKTQDILQWLETLNIPRTFNGEVGDCSLCCGTMTPCGDTMIGIRIDESRTEEGKHHWRKEWLSKQELDGFCKFKPVVRATIAALCGYDQQFLGKLLAERLMKENGVDLSAENQMRLWFRRRVSLSNVTVLRLLFIFEMLVFAFDCRRQLQATSKEKNISISDPTSKDNQYQISEPKWDTEQEVKAWRESVNWWVGKCGYCAGRGLRGSQITHSLRKCPRGGAKQLTIRLGEAIHLEGLKAQGGCRQCGMPREFCQKWEKKKEGEWRELEYENCQYGELIYDTVIGLLQSEDSEYWLGLYITIQEEGDEEFGELDDESIALWLGRKIVVAEVEATEMIRQLYYWTNTVRSTKL
jgi:hypothetical protein